MKLIYRIVSTQNKKDYWSNSIGWTTKDQATIFTAEQRFSPLFNLPMGGKWTKPEGVAQ